MSRTEIDEATRLLSRVRTNQLDDESLLDTQDRLEKLGRMVDSLRVSTAAEVELRSDPAFGADGLSQRLGYRRGTHLIERVTRVAPAEAARRVRLGGMVAPRAGGLPPLFPHVAAALADGSIGLDAAAVITRCLTQAARTAAPDDLDLAEQQLVAVAGIEPAEIVGIHARVWRERLDPDGAEPRYDELHAKRRFSIGREVDGLTPFGGVADPAAAALLRAALNDRTGPAVQPRFLDPADAGDEIPDPRTREQKSFDVFVGLLTAGSRADQSRGPAPIATVLATIELADLENGAGVGWIDDVAEPVPASVVQELVCDSGLQRVVFGHGGEILALGTRERFFTAAQRKALAARDGGCVANGCKAPPSWCHAHHVIFAEHGGPTDVDNGALLCSAHHHDLHTGKFELRMVRGRPQIRSRSIAGQDSVWKTAGRSRVRMAKGVHVT
jgi:hypothetical protein